MIKGNGPAPSRPGDSPRLPLDARAAILPMDRRDRLAELLTDNDVETLKHLAREGMGRTACGRSRRISPIWRLGRTPLPASRCRGRRRGARVEIRGASSLGPLEALDRPSKREIDPRHGMPADVADSLRGDGLLRCVAAIPQTPSGGAWRAGAHCTVGKAFGDRSPRRVCVQRCGWPFALRRGRASARASGPSLGMSSIG
jgi:hypothetical protein